ncbi:disease resistance protein RGA3 [Pyrus ussuriensis x Pyrus communis]|uniref:Disease resistance protein RGA3 n=1 Tax=Pyrus ussuriensis x Pyrus communis TaxID=2448454 RepID=A0A5N5G197_9ROSA|nr:disease resistance protein RGA3 [Pyrus ussuriensis x Pyrus communis]
MCSNLVRHFIASTVGRYIRFLHSHICRDSRDARFPNHSGRASIPSNSNISKCAREVKC